MDSVISQYDREYLYNLISYNKILLQRNTLLKDAAKKSFLDKTILDFYNEKMAKLGQKIFNRREEFIKRLQEIFTIYYREISGGKEQVSLEYKSQLLEKDLLALLENNFTRDSVLQHTSVGIHRDDILLKFGNYLMKKLGSQGQQKSFLVALKFAQFDFFREVHKKKPILLLDDIFDKLDFLRVKNIIKLVADNHFGQIFITDTDENRAKQVLDEIHQDNRLFKIKEGEIENYEKE